MACLEEHGRESNGGLGSHLEAAWREAVENGRIFQIFDAPEDDRHGRWRRCDRVGYGVGLDDGIPVNRARNLTTDQELPVEIREKRLGRWGFVCQSHDFRTLRPGYHAVGQSRAEQPVERSAGCGFFCRDASHPLSLLNRSPLLSVALRNRTWNAYPNAAPLDPAGHFLWVPGGSEPGPDPLPHEPQRLTFQLIDDAVELARQCPELVIFFNGIGAGASVDHIHIQAVVRRDRLPIESAPVKTYRNTQILSDYPVQGWVFQFSDAHSPAKRTGEIFARVERLQEQPLPFNLIMTGGRAFLVPRVREKERAKQWGGCIVAGLEVTGRIVSLVNDAFADLDEEAVHTALAQACYPVRELVDCWG
ncbi:MAG: DUF4922 domain-containing protein [Hyphomicrobiales bacterium]|nr:DUF4922 domain-containing protein [Hyphomicrobiales bacterium]